MQCTMYYVTIGKLLFRFTKNKTNILFIQSGCKNWQKGFEKQMLNILNIENEAAGM